MKNWLATCRYRHIHIHEKIGNQNVQKHKRQRNTSPCATLTQKNWILLAELYDHHLENGKMEVGFLHVTHMHM